MGTYEHRRIDTLTVTVHTSPCSREIATATIENVYKKVGFLPSASI